MNTDSTAEPIRVFISYRHANARLLQDLSTSLGWLMNNSQIKAFDDRQILAGDDWDQVIKQELSEADIIILIVTADFMASLYCTQIELRHALERRATGGTRIIPIIAEYCDWQALPIATIASLPKDDKNNLRPLNKWGRNKDLALTQITQQVRQNVERLVNERKTKSSKDLSSPQKGTIHGKIPLNVSVIEDIRSSDPTISSSTTIKYTQQRVDGAVCIKPSMEYIFTLTSGGPIGPLNFTWVPFQWDFPTLDFKILNNSTEAIFFNEIVFDVIESRIDPIPIIVIVPDMHGSNARHVHITNEGWGVAADIKLRFHLIPPEGREITPLYSEPYPYEIMAGDLNEDLNIDLTEALCDAGVNFDGINNLGRIMQWREDYITVVNDEGKKTRTTLDQFGKQQASYLGRFLDGEALVSGVLEYRASDVAGEIKTFSVKFWTLVRLYNESRVGVPVPPSYEYAAKLRSKGTNYKVRAPISHVLKAGEADRFTFRLGVEKSSRHVFVVHLIFNGDEKITSGFIKLSAFIPRRGACFLREITKGMMDCDCEDPVGGLDIIG